MGLDTVSDHQASTRRSKVVHRHKKTKNPDFRISVHGAPMGGPLPTYSQNFIALAAIFSEMLMAFENNNYILDMTINTDLCQGLALKGIHTKNRF